MPRQSFYIQLATHSGIDDITQFDGITPEALFLDVSMVCHDPQTGV